MATFQWTVFVESANKLEFTFPAKDRELFDLLSIAAATSPVCKTKGSAEIMVRDVACFDDVQ